MSPSPTLKDPKSLAKLGEAIYQEKYKTAYEADHDGKFVAINVGTSEAFIGDSPDTALDLAHKTDPRALVHLVRVGFPSAFQLSYASPTTPDWLFG